MANMSSIEWTEATWNPLTGCTKVSPGCKHCYAERMAKRLQAMHHPSYANGFKLTLHERLLELPLHWKQPRTIFVNSMSDLFHRDVPVEFILRVFKTMESASQHQFQVLTKRPERVVELSECLPWPDNVWMGTSVENDRYKFRIDLLRQTGARVKFLSIEPLLGPVGTLNLAGIHWVIVGGESGPGARPMDPQWAVEVRDQCVAQDVPFFFKQWGGTNKKRSGRILEGRTWDEMPTGVISSSMGTPNAGNTTARQLALA
jgi:protein gp37